MITRAAARSANGQAPDLVPHTAIGRAAQITCNRKEQDKELPSNLAQTEDEAEQHRQWERSAL